MIISTPRYHITSPLMAKRQLHQPQDGLFPDPDSARAAEEEEAPPLTRPSDEALNVADNVLRKANGELHGIVRHPVELAAIEPKTRKLTLQSRKLWMFLVSYTLETPATATEQGFLWRVPLLKLEKDTGFNSKDREMLKESIRACQKTLVEWGSSAKDKKTGEVRPWSSTQLLGSVEFVEDINRTVCVEWSFPPVFLKHLREYKHYFESDLALALDFNRHSSLALAQVVNRFKTNRGGLTERMPWRKWIPILTGESEEYTEMRDKVHSAKKGVAHEKYSEWRYFNRDVVAPAVTEVNQKMLDVFVEAKPIKVGPGARGRVEELQFKITLKSDYKRPSEDRTKLDEGQQKLADLLVKAGVSPSRAPVMVRRYSAANIQQVLDEVASQGGQVRNPGGLISSKLEELQATETANEVVDDPKTTPVLTELQAEEQSLSDFRAELISQARAKWKTLSSEIAADYKARFERDVLAHAVEVVRKSYAKKGLDVPMVAAQFWPWLAKEIAGEGWNPTTAELLTFERRRIQAQLAEAERKSRG